MGSSALSGAPEISFGLPGSERIRVAYLSTYPPRECGIATYCRDLLNSTLEHPGVEQPFVLAMETPGSARRYQWPVAMIVGEHDEEDYEQAAELVNRSTADVVSVQHEFGIFGGVDGKGLGRFFRRLRKPAVTTLHTVVPDPEPEMRAALMAVAEASDHLVVMNDLAIDILRRDYGVDPARISVIHHGAPEPASESREEAKERLGLSGRKVLSTFGLVARGKGIEYAIRALPAILARHPEVCYLIIGQTHPNVQRFEQESYREELEREVRELGLERAVQFVNHYLTDADIVRYLAATDVYLTPYLNPHQITSGTLAYAVGAGRACVATPYLYARFLLGNGRGLLVDFRSAEAIADAVNRILGNPGLQAELERRAAALGREMRWPRVGARYLSCFREVCRVEAVALDGLSASVARSELAQWESESDHAVGRHGSTAALGPSAAAD